MSNIAIKVENLSKAYQLGEIGTGTISRDLERWYARIRGKEDPFLLIGETNDRTAKSSSDIVWSLKDINFEIEQGDAIGIIGRNGAGKSTLLKVLSRVTSPTSGRIKGKGRIASLLEVGTGFHPELTGRENIYLNGAILGMRKKEITRKFDEIVDFAGVERYIDTPVKRYSSGMYVRLAFAVAAHLESEILIVDEVLAVGDAEFQKKCLGKMGDVSKGEGRTVLFVSHNMGSIMDLCRDSILLHHGSVEATGKSGEVINKYITGNALKSKIWDREDTSNEIASFRKIYISNGESIINNLEVSQENYLNILVDIQDIHQLKTLAFEIKSFNDYSLFCSHDYDIGKITYKQGLNHFRIKLPENLRPGSYYINIGSNGAGFSTVEYFKNVIDFEVINSNEVIDNRPGIMMFPLKWIS
ncbi:polysaccharide ABC transporter ATP-binding protein [Pedobacter xixiisoli]|uniref:Lipopolysaccharide transport system ATP-binding protein n=1 Tax=Pedobacter xixiisoli TaxID=1476464 RepID=A0A286A9Q4_9SPHI|nr:ABC transporter ATP-binding protein [Pedobacter xixiisoli]SOD18638.1 lipopolysaccharide transport system ATP-binding protein [Pedobacter xixiisoli]